MKTLFFILFAFTGSLSNEIDKSTFVETELIAFTLANRSSEDVTLKLPGQSKSVLAAKSQIKLKLAEGSKIFYFEGKQKKLLLTVQKENEGKMLFVG